MPTWRPSPARSRATRWSINRPETADWRRRGRGMAVRPPRWPRANPFADRGAASNIQAQKAPRIGAQDRLSRRLGDFCGALHERDRLHLPERKIGTEHDVAGIDLGG